MRGLLFAVLIISVVLAANVLPVRAETVKPVQYAMPYPGMLPDSPLYFLKVFRDKLFVLLISDQTTKSFYLLALSDKRLGAGQMLVQKGEKGLAVTTFLEAESYFAQAVEEGNKAGKAKKNSDLWAKLVTAAAKHSEVLEKEATKFGGNDGQRLQTAFQESEQMRNRVNDFVLGNFGS